MIKRFDKLKRCEINIIYTAIGLLYILYYPIAILLASEGYDSVLVDSAYSLTEYSTYTLVTVGTIIVCLALILIKPLSVQSYQESRMHVKILRETALRIALFSAVCCFVIVWLLSVSRFQGAFNRANRMEVEALLTQVWVLIVISSQGLCFVGLYFYERLSSVTRVLLVLLISAVAITDFVLIGGRRAILPIILFLLYHRGWISLESLNYRRLLAVCVLFVIFFGFGGAREFIYHNESRFLTVGAALSLAGESNEFQEIGLGIDNATKYAAAQGLMKGETYLKAPLIFIPRDILPEKPVSLTYVTGAMVSPFAEAFLNFGIFGVVPIATGILLIYKMAAAGRASFRGCCLVAYVFDQMRTGLAEVLYTAVALVIIYLSLVRRKTIPYRAPRVS